MYITYLVDKFGACIVEGRDEAVGEPLLFGLITDVDLSSVGHAHCIQRTPAVHTEGCGLHQLCRGEIIIIVYTIIHSWRDSGLDSLDFDFATSEYL